MSQRTAIRVLSFALLAMSQLSFAQLIEIEDDSAGEEQSQQQQNQEQQEAAVVPQQLQNQKPSVETQPVSISAGMSPQTVAPAPVAQTYAAPARVQYPASAVSTDPSGAMSVNGATTGIGGANPGNANTGGVQVQSVNVMQDATANMGNRSDLIRRERMRQELENETRMMEKVEQGRLEDETRRSKTIEDFKSSVGRDGEEMPVMVPQAMQTVPVMSPLATSPIVPVSQDNNLAEVAMIANRSRVSLSPIAGYSWDRNNSEMRTQNYIQAGAALTGQINKNFALEGVFLYGYDEFKPQMAPYGAPVPAPYYGSAYTPYAYSPYSYGYAPYAMGAPYRARDTYQFTAGGNIGYLIRQVRPYALARLGGLYSHYRIDNAYTTAYAQNIGWSRSTTHFIGVFGGGMDFRLATNMTLGASFEYMAVFNKQYTEMQRIYGDSNDRYSVLGSLQIFF